VYNRKDVYICRTVENWYPSINCETDIRYKEGKKVKVLKANCVVNVVGRRNTYETSKSSTNDIN